MNSWEQIRLRDISVLITKGTTPTTLGHKFTESGINYVKSESVTDNGRIDKTKFVFIDQNTHNALKRSILAEDDILFSMAGMFIGKTAVVTKDILPANTNQAVGIIRLDKTKANPKFIHYFLHNKSYTQYINNLVSQSAQPNLNLAEIGNLPISLPSLPEQRVLAEILGTFDNKIEVNRRMNTTLESMARAVFRQWFVDGEEVENWKISQIGEIADVIDCLHSKKPERQEVGKPFLQLSNILDNGLLDVTDIYFITKEDYDYWISRIEASPGDCVVTNVGRVGAIAQIPEGFKAALGRNMTAIRCKKEYPYPTFLIECLMSDAMRQEINNKTDSGTILDALNVKNIPLLQFVLPPHSLLQKFEEQIRPIRAKMEANLKESRTLGRLRDSLLPKLMRGEVRVK
jgi:type I restriction enzyme S subunit